MPMPFTQQKTRISRKCEKNNNHNLTIKTKRKKQRKRILKKRKNI